MGGIFIRIHDLDRSITLGRVRIYLQNKESIVRQAPVKPYGLSIFQQIIKVSLEGDFNGHHGAFSGERGKMSIQGLSRFCEEHLAGRDPAQPDLGKRGNAGRRFVSLHKMFGHDVPGPHIDGVVLGGGKPGSVRLTLKIVQSRGEAFSIIDPPKGMEEIMGKHSQMGVFSPDKYASPEFFPASRF